MSTCPQMASGAHFQECRACCNDVSNGNYYARTRVYGKLIREGLKTKSWSTARLRRTDFTRRHQEARDAFIVPLFPEAVELFNGTSTKPGLNPQSHTGPGASRRFPAGELKRVRVKQKDLQIPESSRFKTRVENLRKCGAGWGQSGIFMSTADRV